MGFIGNGLVPNALGVTKNGVEDVLDGFSQDSDAGGGYFGDFVCCSFD
jgi:hypothetical protein